MSGLNLEKLKEAQETLKSRGGGDGSKNWLNVSKIDGTLDCRVMDPLPAMDGLYFQEVGTWWINGVKLISPRVLDPRLKRDVLDDILDEAKETAKKDKTLAKLLNATNDQGISVIQFKWDYWVPILQFEWKLDRNNNIIGITGKDGSYDIELIKQFIVDDRVKILQANITCLKAINTLLTSRGGASMLDPTKGRNIQIQKTGKGKETKYAVVPDPEDMPMPLEFYAPDKAVDPFEVAQAMLFTDDYMAAVLEHYLYGDTEVPEKENCYRFPEIREALKNRYKDDEEAEEDTTKSSARRRRSSYEGIVGAEKAPEDPAPSRRSKAANEEPAPVRQSRAAATETPTEEGDLPWEKPQRGSVEGPVRNAPAGRRGRNLASELK